MWPIYVSCTVALIPAVCACFIKSKIAKGIFSGVSFFGFLVLTFLCAAFVLPSYIGLHGYWLPFVLGGIIFTILILFIWKPFKITVRRTVTLSLTGIIIILTAVFIVPPVYRESIPQVGRDEVDLGSYVPFGDYRYNGEAWEHYDSKVAMLSEESTLRLDGELPRLDGATALYPLYSAFVRAIYPAPEPIISKYPDNIDRYLPYGDFRDPDYGEQYLALCSRTSVAFENLIDGYADIVFLMGVSDEQWALADERGLELTVTPIGREAFVFFVNSRNDISDISENDIKHIYSGEVTNWRDIGGRNDAIRAYQRPDESGSQVMLRQIMGDTPIVRAPTEDIHDTMSGMYERVANYRNYRNSLGYSFLYYIRDMIGENKVKFLSINGIAPTHENIANGTYPFANDFYAITVRSGEEYLNRERTENIDKLLEWITSPQGQYLVNETGYVPLA